MVPEDLLFWLAPLVGTLRDDQNVLCQRHADALTVPRGWTLDDRREEFPRLFRPRPVESDQTHDVRRRRRRASSRVEQLVIDGTGEISRPAEPEPTGGPAAGSHAETETAGADPAPWRPEFDHDNDLDGLLETESPLLARAFRGTGRRRD